MISRATTVTAILLAISALANAGAAWQYLRQRDVITQLRSDLRQSEVSTTAAREAAAACSSSVDALAASAQVLSGMVEQARAEAQASARKNYARADQILSAPASVPGDVCASAQARVRDILAGRARGGEQ